MSRAVAELERDIRALSVKEKEELLGVLVSELDVPAGELQSLASELISTVKRTDKALESAVSRLENFDEELRQGRVEAREAALRLGQEWPFGAPSSYAGN